MLKKNYDEVPWYWFVALLLLSFFAGMSAVSDARLHLCSSSRPGLIVVFKGETTLPWWAYIIALLLGGFITPFSTLLHARMGTGISTIQLMKMIAGALNPGKPVANLYVRLLECDRFTSL